MMIGAQRVAAVIAMATVPCIREKDVVLLVVANPLATTFRAGELAFLAT
jgi:hypothetical protein